jgi:hypothetical protein
MIVRTLVATLTFSALFAADAQQDVLAAQRQWRDEKVLAAIEADDFCVVFGDGKIQAKSDQLANIRKPLPIGLNTKSQSRQPRCAFMATPPS